MRWELLLLLTCNNIGHSIWSHLTVTYMLEDKDFSALLQKLKFNLCFHQWKKEEMNNPIIKAHACI